MARERPMLLERPEDPLVSLQRVKAERLRELVKRRPGQKHYKQVLRAYLDADSALQTALLERVDAVPVADTARPIAQYNDGLRA